MNINKAMFKENLIQTLNEIAISQNIRIDEKSKFLVLPIKENGKKLNSTDEYIQRGMLNEENLSGVEFDFETVTDMLGCKTPYYPIWINVSLKEIRDGIPIIDLQVSLRFRKPSLLHNQDTGHPPFKAVIPSSNISFGGATE